MPTWLSRYFHLKFEINFLIWTFEFESEVEFRWKSTKKKKDDVENLKTEASRFWPMCGENARIFSFAPFQIISTAGRKLSSPLSCISNGMIIWTVSHVPLLKYPLTELHASIARLAWDFSNWDTSSFSYLPIWTWDFLRVFQKINNGLQWKRN